MSYCCFEDVALLIGASPSDFEYLGEPMGLPEYMMVVNEYIKVAEDMINRYCNVSTFTEHEVTNELHSVGTLDGRSSLSGYSSPLVYGITDLIDDYDDSNRRVMPREYPVSSITNVEVSYSHPTSKKVWTHLVPITDESGGQYEVVKRFRSVYVVLSYTMPRFGINNVRLTYTAGYPLGHEIYSQLKIAVAMLVRNMLNYKKSNQEAYTIRGSSVQSYSQMFAGYEGFFMSAEVRMILDRWRRPYNTPDAYI